MITIRTIDVEEPKLRGSVCSRMVDVDVKQPSLLWMGKLLVIIILIIIKCL